MKQACSRRFPFIFLIVAALVLGTAIGAFPAAKPFYQGKTIVLIVPTNPGGGYDFYARTIANIMQDELPGSTIIVKNVPGAGNIIGVNELYRAAPNGLTFGIINPGLIATQLIGQQGVRFDLGKMTWLGGTGESPYGLIVAAGKYKDLQDVEKAGQPRIASAGTGTLSYAIPAMLQELNVLKNNKILLGYRGAEAELGMMQGNIDGQWASWSAVQSFVKDGHATPVLFLGNRPAGYEKVPRLEDVVKGAKYKPFIGFMNTMACTLVRGFAGPPNIPADRLKILRQAFKKTVLSPKYQELMRKAGHPAGLIDARTTGKLVGDSLGLPPEYVKIIRAAFAKK